MMSLTEKEVTELPMLLTADQARKILGIGKSAIYELIRQEKIPAINLGTRKTRIPKAEFLEWINKNIQPAK